MALNNRIIKVELVAKALTYIIALTGFLSVAGHISLSYGFAFIALSLFSLHLEHRKRFLIPRWILNILSLAIAALAAFRIDPDDPVIAIIEALLILNAIKLLEEKRFRDHMQIYLISMLLLTGSALLSIDMTFLFYFISLMFLLAVAIVMLTYHSQDKALSLSTDMLLRIISKALLIPLLSIPMTVFMFIILPRTSHPLLSSLSRGSASSSGFTDNVSLGKVSKIQEDATVIFRAQMPRINDEALYWRGIVLDSFDGTSWKRLEREDSSEKSDNVSGRHIEQTIYLEPYENRYLFALDKPVAISLRNLKRSSDLTYSLSQPIMWRTKYVATSALSDVIPDDLINKDIYLTLPDRDMDEIKKLAEDLTMKGDNPATAKAILNFLRAGSYSYSLKDLPITEDPLQEFLFNHRYGNCEYFASAMAVMLRAADIPSRVVGGYRGGYYNTAGNYYLVSQKNAHVWVEAYIDNRGWVRFDPTPAGIEIFSSPGYRGVAFRVRLLLDTLQYQWNALIINYDFTKQVLLFYKLKAGLTKPKITFSFNKAAAFKYAVILSVSVSAVILLYFLVFRRKTAEQKVIALFLKEMVKRGYRKSSSEGLEEFAARISDADLRRTAHEFARSFEESFYKDRPLTREHADRLKMVIRGKRERLKKNAIKN